MPPPPTSLHRPFDPWNSSSTGHQRNETRPGSGWRESRRRKLDVQFRGSPAAPTKETRHGYAAEGSAGSVPRRSVVELLRRPGLMRRHDTNDARGRDGLAGKHVYPSPASAPSSAQRPSSLPKQHDLEEPAWSRPRSPRKGADRDAGNARGTTPPPSRQTLRHDEPRDSSSSSSVTVTTSVVPESLASSSSLPSSSKRGIFTGTNIYVNGSTFPHVSDHKLKHIITQHGGAMALHLGRRTVTHVVLGTTGGGGLAAGKMERELRRMRGCGAYFVGVEW
ncbi:hypothetical protein E4U21_006491 [Claviceps maximensis]|nr:hypothetical protein E4U21_006491 [Claviceps maximensis]